MAHRNHVVSIPDGYAIWASSYDQEHNPLILTEEPRVKALLEALPRPATALDAAAGTGRWAVYLAERGVQVTAIDQSPEMLAVARQKARVRGLGMSFAEGRLDQLPLPSAAFDLVICALALSHVPDLGAAIAELARVVRPGGYLIATDFHPQAIANSWENTIFRGEDAYIIPLPGYTRTDYLEAIAAAGGELVHVEDILVRDEPSGAIQAPDLDAFLAQYGDWPFCLIIFARRTT
jgi:ubiquinone/menaquinone biosynthesis C-methylase UbiE